MHLCDLLLWLNHFCFEGAYQHNHWLLLLLFVLHEVMFCSLSFGHLYLLKMSSLNWILSLTFYVTRILQRVGTRAMLFSHYISGLEAVLKQFGSTCNNTEGPSWVQATLWLASNRSDCQFSFLRGGWSHFITWFYANKRVKCQHTFSWGWPCCGLLAIDWTFPLFFNHFDNCRLI